MCARMCPEVRAGIFLCVFVWETVYVGVYMCVRVCVKCSFSGEAVRLAPAGSAVGSVVLLGGLSPCADPKAYREGLQPVILSHQPTIKTHGRTKL